jgi:hypothetical protein
MSSSSDRSSGASWSRSFCRTLTPSGVAISWAPEAAAAATSGSTWSRAASGVAGVRVWTSATFILCQYMGIDGSER